MHNYLTDTVVLPSVLLASDNDVTCSFRKAMAVSMFVMEGGSRNGNLTGKNCQFCVHLHDIDHAIWNRSDIMPYNITATSCLPHFLILPRPRAVICNTRESRGTLWISGVEYGLKAS